MEFAPFPSSTCVLTEDGTRLTVRLAEALSERGWRVVVLAMKPTPTVSVPDQVERVVVSAPGEAQIATQLETLCARYGDLRAFIHLHPANPNDPLRISEPETARLKGIFFVAKHLKTVLQNARSGRSCFMSVTRLDGRLGVGGSHSYSPVAGGLFGLIKTLQKEWDSVFCRAVDLSPDLEVEAAVRHLMAELHDPERRLSEVGYAEERTTLACEPIPPVPISADTGIGPDYVFLVSGGARGITAECVVRLAKLHRCRFILLGRSSLGEGAASAAHCEGEPQLQARLVEQYTRRGEKPEPRQIRAALKALEAQRQIAATLRAVADAGGLAVYRSVDLGDPVALRVALADAQAEVGAVTGILHGAGNIADKRIEHKREDDFALVYSAKVQGLGNLLQCLPPQSLRHLLLFSSVVGFYGNPGQADYALANEILNKFAYQMKYHHPDCHVTSINWGAWDGGMVTPQLLRAYEQMNLPLRPIPLDVGTRRLAEQMHPANRDQVQVVIGEAIALPERASTPERFTARIHRRVDPEANRFLADHTIGEHPVLPSMCAAAWMIQGCEQLCPGYRFFALNELRVLKGIVFDGREPAGLCLEVEGPGEEDGEVELVTTISSAGEGALPRRHFTARVVLVRQLPACPRVERPLDNRAALPCAPLYQNGTLFHGPSFQGLDEVLSLEPDGLIVRCRLAGNEANQGQFPVGTFNPYLADVHLQAALVYLQHQRQQGCLPAQVERFEQFRPLAFGETFYLSFEQITCSQTLLRGNLLSCDAQGQLYSRLVGAEFTIGSQLKSLFERSRRPQWKE